MSACLLNKPLPRIFFLENDEIIDDNVATEDDENVDDDAQVDTVEERDVDQGWILNNRFLRFLISSMDYYLNIPSFFLWVKLCLL